MLSTLTFCFLFASVHCANDDLIYYSSNETYSDTSEVIRPNGTRIYIDRTNLLEIFFNETLQPYNLLTCPRLFGKTTLIAMIEDFAQMEIDNRGIPINVTETYTYQYHKDCKIGSNYRLMSDHLAKYQVIVLDMHSSSYQAITISDLVRDLKEQLKQCFEKFKWLLEVIPRGSNDLRITRFDINFIERVINGTMKDDEIPECLRRLSTVLYRFYNRTKVIILVNEYDNVMITSLVTQRTDISKFYETVNEMLHNALKAEARHVAYGFMTGTSSLAYYMDHPTLLDNVVHRPFLEDHPFSTFCGFTEPDIRVDLYEKYKINRRERSKVQRYYSGYDLHSKNVSLYNPHSVVNYFLADAEYHRVTGVFWDAGLSHEMFVRFLANEYFMKMVFKATEKTMKLPFDLAHKYESTALCILMRIRKDEYGDFKGWDIRHRIMFTFILEQGYIIRGVKPDLFAVPNLEVKQRVQTAVVQHYQRKRVPPLNITKNMLSILKSPAD